MQQHHNQRGFTLIESLFVCWCVAIIIAIGVPSALRLYNQFMLELAVKQFTLHLRFAQGMSMGNSERVEVNFEDNKNGYEVVRTRMRKVRNYILPGNVKVRRGTKTLPIVYTSSGTINSAGSIILSNENGTYVIMLLLGKGKFYVKAA